VVGSNRTLPGGAPGRAMEIVHTLRAVVVPHGWRSVTYGGVTLDVPSGWPLRPWSASLTCTGSIYRPTVLLGEPPRSDIGHMCLARAIPLAAVVDVGALVLGPPRQAGHVAGTVTFPSYLKPTEINGLQVDLTSELFSAQTPHFPKKRFVDEALAYVPLRNLWVFVSVGTSPSLPGGGPGRAMRIVRTIRAA
jgi:hypothetical protein